MQFFILVVPVMVGFLFGYFLATPVVVSITVIAAIAAVRLRPKREQELGAVIGMVAWVVLGLGTVAMWATHLYVSGVDLGIPDISGYTFRQ